jgi:hypothetical protein
MSYYAAIAALLAVSDAASTTVWGVRQPFLAHGEAIQSFVQKVTRNRMLRQFQQSGGDASKCPDLEKCNCHCLCTDTVYKAPIAGPAPCPVEFKKSETQKKEVAEPPPDCLEGTLMIPVEDSFTCQKITPDVLDFLKYHVLVQKNILDEAVASFNEMAQDASDVLTANALPCAGGGCNTPSGKDVLIAHEQLDAAINLFTEAQKAYIPDHFDPAAEAVEANKACKIGEEFVLLGDGELPTTGNVHCEPWTVNGTRVQSPKTPTKEHCGVLCRANPSCKGFALHEKGPCVWWDSDEISAAAPSSACAAGQVTDVYRKQCTADCAATDDLFTSYRSLQAARKTIDALWSSAYEKADEAAKVLLDRSTVTPNMDAQIEWAKANAAAEYFYFCQFYVFDLRNRCPHRIIRFKKS